MQLIDTHTHLQWPKFDEDRDAVIERAREAGVAAMLTLATDLTTSYRVIELAERHPDVFAAVGIHPTDAVKAGPDDLARIAELARHPKVVAIGETGMDFYWDKTTGAVQEQLFRAQLELGAQLDLPVVVHNREAGPAILQVLAKAAGLPMRGVFHCFGEDHDYARRVLDYGFHISFTGNITYKNNGLAAVAQVIPLERLLLETDSPFMAPVPHRGQRNEPAYVRYVAEKHAEIRRVPLTEIAAATTANARELFRLPD